MRRLHNREPLRIAEHAKTVQAINEAKVLAAIQRLADIGRPFSKVDAVHAAGLYLINGRAGRYIDKRPELLEAYQQAMQKLGVGV